MNRYFIHSVAGIVLWYMKPLLLLSFSLTLLLAHTGQAQSNTGDDAAAGRISPKELSIPASPVFDLMGVTPSQITRTSDIKDFKVDWSFKSWRLSPNLALQSQPVWEIIYNRYELSKYQRASGFMRRLAAVDVSVGTVQNEDNDRRIGFAVKINLFKARDPLLAKELYQDIGPKFRQQREDLEKQLKELQSRLDTTRDILQKPAIRSEIQTAQQSLADINPNRMKEINKRAAIWVAENWNAASLDIAMGRIYTYQTDSTGSLLRLRLNRNTGWGIWLNGGFGIGKKLFLSGLLRSTWYQEELNFILHNTGNGQDLPQSAVADNNLYSAGANLRYGGAIYNFFIEFFYERKGLKTPVRALDQAFKTPGPNLEIVASSVQWNVVEPNTINFGGDWRVGRNLILNYGMRCVFDPNWKLQTFTPVVALSCMMR
jgi:hypothetical protein